VEDLDAILSIKGIDMVQFGSAGYAMSIGLAGKWSHPCGQGRTAHHRDGPEAGHPSTRRDRRPWGGRGYQEMGVKHFCLGWNVGILHDWWRANGRRMREHLETQETTR
jgi:2-keto-3-deoxy-L-rhamnonate aldolase RhmA